MKDKNVNKEINYCDKISDKILVYINYFIFLCYLFKY